MTDAKNTPAPIIATLKYGLYFDYKGKVWDNHKAREKGGDDATQPVTAEEKEYLLDNAFVGTEIDGTDYTKCRFIFSDDAPVKTRQRVRAE